MARLRVLSLTLAIVWSFMLTGCGGNAGTPIYPDDLSGIGEVSKFINAQTGGTIEGYGARLYVPPGALPADGELTMKVMQAGAEIGARRIAGAVEISPHLASLNGPVMVEFPIAPGMFSPYEFPVVQYWDGSQYFPLTLQNGAIARALISEDATSALFSTDHFSLFALLADQPLEYLDNTDLAFGSLDSIHTRFGGEFHCDECILTHDAIRFYLGGLDEISNKIMLVDDLIHFYDPWGILSPVYDPELVTEPSDLRARFYRELFGDLVMMRTVAEEYRERNGNDTFPLESVYNTVRLAFSAGGAQIDLQNWVRAWGDRSKYHILMDATVSESWAGEYTLVRYVAAEEAARAAEFRNRLQAQWPLLEAGGVTDHMIDDTVAISGFLDETCDFFVGVSVANALVRMNCDALHALLGNVNSIDPALTGSALGVIQETRSVLDLAPANFAEAMVHYMLSDPEQFILDNGMNVSNAVFATASTGLFTGIVTPMGAGITYRFLTETGIWDATAEQIATYSAAVVPGTKLRLVLSPYVPSPEGWYSSWEPELFIQNLQRALLAGDLGVRVFGRDNIGGLESAPGYLSARDLGGIMRMQLAYMYVRLYCDAWGYIAESDVEGFYDWSSLSLQRPNILMELDSTYERFSRLRGCPDMVELLYGDITAVLDDHLVAIPDILTPPQGAVQVNQPNGGDLWLIGSPATIRWSWLGDITHVDIDLSLDGGQDYTVVLADDHPNSGRFDLAAVGDWITDQARVRVSAAADHRVLDESDGDFLITLPYITVTRPNGGEAWVIGDPANIQWEWVGNIPAVDIDLSLDSGANYTVSLATGVPNTGQFHMDQVGDWPADQARVRITSSSDERVGDESDADFRITRPYIEVTDPNGGETWIIGEGERIEWGWIGTIPEVDIDLSLDGGATYNIVLAVDRPNTGRLYMNPILDWPSTQARVRVTASADASLFDESDDDFTIQNPPPPEPPDDPVPPGPPGEDDGDVDITIN